jgi:RNA polymerase sigma-70 factor (ECF subfamily)
LENLDAAVARVLAGDASAFHQIVDATSPTLVRLSIRMMGNVADGEDAMQEAYVKAYRGLVEGRFDGRAQFGTWLRRIVVNTAIDAMRARARTPRASSELVDAAPDEHTSAETSLALREISDWLGALPPDQRAALVLKSIEGHTSSEVAELLGCSEGAVEQRLVRARLTLRQRSNQT